MEAQLSASDMLFINGDNYLHIDAVEIFTGNDDHQETDCVEIHAGGENLIVKQLLTKAIRKSKYRLREEPGIRIFITSEAGENFIVSLSPHKGNIRVDVEEVTNETL